MFKSLIEAMYSAGLAADTELALKHRAKATFHFLEIACNYIPPERRSIALDDMYALLSDLTELWNEEPL